MGEAALPNEALEVELLDRFKWTQQELDAQDLGRLFTGVITSNIAASLGRVQAWLDTGGRAEPMENDWLLWREIQTKAKQIKAADNNG